EFVRLLHEVTLPQFFKRGAGVGGQMAADHDHFQRGAANSDDLQYVDATCAGHVQVEQDRVVFGGGVADRFNCLKTRRGGGGAIPVSVECIRQQGTQGFFVVDDQQRFSATGKLAWRAGHGRGRG